MYFKTLLNARSFGGHEKTLEAVLFPLITAGPAIHLTQAGSCWILWRLYWVLVKVIRIIMLLMRNGYLLLLGILKLS